MVMAAVVLAATLTGCPPCLGDICTHDEVCPVDHICVFVGPESDEPMRCVVPCAEDEDCPAGCRCKGRGSSGPFLDDLIMYCD